MISSRIFRLIHTDSLLWQSSTKSLLAKLRKKTGYTFSNCKRALELHDNDLIKAETWLKEQAQAHGWTQAAKLQGRKTTQGIVAAVVQKNNGALVEINCETDFVARNKQFHSLVETIANAVIHHTSKSNSDKPIEKVFYDGDTLKSLLAPDGKSLLDHSVLTIGSVGENITIRRAISMTVSPDFTLAGCTHPAPVEPVPISFGKYGALVALKSNKKLNELAMQLCQHVIGMNPSKVGDTKVDLPDTNVDDEICMVYQEFLLDPTLSIQQILIDAEAEILDFYRFEMGELLEGEQNLDSVETCG